MGDVRELFKESVVEHKVCLFARRQGVLVIKLTLLGRIGWPDRLFLYMGKILFIEFKRVGEVPRPAQVYIHSLLRKHQFEVLVTDNETEGKSAIEKMVGR